MGAGIRRGGGEREDVVVDLDDEIRRAIGEPADGRVPVRVIHDGVAGREAVAGDGDLVVADQSGRDHLRLDAIDLAQVEGP